MLRGVYDFVLHVESFRNIDLWHQGVYSLRARLHIDQVCAHPYAHTRPTLPRSSLNVVYPCSFPNQPSSCFQTQHVFMKYVQEVAFIDDICHYRLDVDADAPQSIVTLECTLMFYEVNKASLKTAKPNYDSRNGVPVRKSAFKLTYVGHLHQFVPLLFEQSYACVINLSLHSVCIDYRLRGSKLQLAEYALLTLQQKEEMLRQSRREIHLHRRGQITAAQAETSKQSMIRMKQQLLQEYSDLCSAISPSHPQLSSPSRVLECEEQISRGASGLEESVRGISLARNRERSRVFGSLKETNALGERLNELWEHFIGLIRLHPSETLGYYQRKHEEIEGNVWRGIVRSYSSYGDTTVPPRIHSPQEISQGIVNLYLGRSVFPSTFEESLRRVPSFTEHTVEQTPPEEQEAIPSEESCISTPKSSRSKRSHLVVFVHGFKGNSNDMKTLKSTVYLLAPHCICFCSTRNEGDTDEDILVMGHNLASEVNEELSSLGYISKISFVGHSLGGLIIRAALPHLSSLKHKFHAFITFSSPHLGYSLNTSSVIELGLWVLQKFNSSKCLQQLSMKDHENIQSTCLFKLSQMGGLQHFKEVILFSSKQDSYAPYQSARVEMQEELRGSEDLWKIAHCAMAQNILKGVRKIRRVDVQFTITTKDMGSLIGRTAHIMFLDGKEIIRALFYNHPSLFC